MRKISLLAGGLFLFITLVVGAVRLSGLLHSFMASPANILLKDSEGHVNILLLGVGDIGHSGANLTDTMIVASLDVNNPPNIVLLSIPRDLLFLDAKGMSQGKINSLYADYKSRYRYEKMNDAESSRSALKELSATISSKVGISIPYYIKSDFTAFTQLIDSVGGLDVNVPKRIVDYTYPLEEGSVGIYEVQAGLQHMSGEDALKYVRTRHSSTDFDRSQRQQQILQLLSEKMKKQLSTNPQNLLGIFDIVKNNVETNFSTDELIALARGARGLSSERFITMQLNFNSGGNGVKAEPGGFIYAPPLSEFGSAAILLPIATSPKLDSWSAIATFARMLTGKRDIYLAHQNIIVRSTGAAYGVASDLVSEISRYGFTVSEQKAKRGEIFASKPTSTLCYSADQKAQKNPALYFSSLLDIPAKECDGTGSGIVIELGKSYKFQPIVLLSQDTPPAALSE
ncbi:MAG: LCP family protein [Candidatus Peribacteraceae bacterium]|nr:LCP family protein [Candidatus Peribacteraceae bacterium]